MAKAESALEIGCGTGMAGVYAINKNTGIRSIDFSDIEPNAIRSVQANEGFSPSGVFQNYIVGDGFAEIGDKKYDAIIACAVPATPGI